MDLSGGEPKKLRERGVCESAGVPLAMIKCSSITPEALDPSIDPSRISEGGDVVPLGYVS